MILSMSMLLIGMNCSAQLIATVQMKNKVEGICNHSAVYALFDGFEGQREPTCSMSEEQMQRVLNEKLQFLKDHPKFKSKGMISVYINCKGEPLEWRISVETKSNELDGQILEVFKSFNEWEAGTLDGKKVDSAELISYKIKKGVLTIE